MFFVRWLIGASHKVQHAYNTFVYRLASNTDVTGPTIMSGLVGR